jgi:FkbM family methyltransferase
MAPTYPVLSEVLAGADLKLVDIGGRGEAFAGVVALARFAHYYVSEPDAAEAARLADTLPKETRWRGLTVFAEAIASQTGPATLYLTRSPGMSSLLQPDGRVAGRYWIAPKFEVVGHSSVPTIGLDEASRRYGFTDAAFLKLDTQGSELDILLSGPDLVRDSVVGIHTEASFQPFYRGQPLFADVDSHLRANGFSLVTMNRTLLRRAGFDESLYSRRTVTWAHCLYLREPEDLQERGPQLVRLLALAIAFHHFDLALDIVGRLTGTGVVSDASIAQLAADVRQQAVDVTNRLKGIPAKDLGPDGGLTARWFKDRRRFE